MTSTSIQLQIKKFPSGCHKTSQDLAGSNYRAHHECREAPWAFGAYTSNMGYAKQSPTREARPLGLLIRQDLGSTGRSTEDMAMGSSNSNNTHGNNHSSGR